MKKTGLTVISLIALACALTLVAQQAGSPTKRIEATRSGSEIIAKLQEIVAIRERQFKNFEELLRAGRAGFDDSAEIDLAEARVRLAQERHQPDAVVAELRDLIAVHQRRLKRVQAVANDRERAGGIDTIKVGLLEAEIRLLKEQK